MSLRFAMPWVSVAACALIACSGQSGGGLGGGAADSGAGESSSASPGDGGGTDGVAPHRDGGGPGNDGSATDTGTGTGPDGSSGGGLDASGDTGSLDSGFDVATEDVAAGSCNAYADTAPRIDVTWSPTTIPAPLGGTIVDGVYDESAFVHYTGAGGDAGATGQTHQYMAVIAGGVMQVVYSDTPGVDVHMTVQLAPSGTAPNMKESCPTMAAQIWDGYTATPSQVTFYGSTHGESFTLLRR
jgi:hypothetical protein